MKTWKKAVLEEEIPPQSGASLKYGNQQIALFHYEKDIWYAVQNCCPHDGQMTLSRGLLGDINGEAKVTCPLYKHPFSLKTGVSLSDTAKHKLITYPTKVEEGIVYIETDL